MPLGFATHHPGGMADNSPTFQRWDLDSAGKSPEGTAETMHRVSRPFGTYARRTAVPNVETLGYCRTSLRDDEWQILVALGFQTCCIADFQVCGPSPTQTRSEQPGARRFGNLRHGRLGSLRYITGRSDYPSVHF